MDTRERSDFLGSVNYFYYEKGNVERLVGFSVEKLKLASPEVGRAYENMQYATKVFEALLREELDDEPDA